jgi:hypothetical protein
MQIIPDLLKDFFICDDFAQMAKSRIDGVQVYSYGRKEGIFEHLQMLQVEFVGKSELELYHALLIVLIRRQIDSSQNVQRFMYLWDNQSEFLLSALDSRWLVSSTDTFMDYGRTTAERAFALAVSVFLNTLKLYETERVAIGALTQKYELRQGRVEIFDGMSAFVIGHGDMVSNLFLRARQVCYAQSVPAKIFLEALGRAKRHDTVYGRFLEVHQADNLKW